MASSLLFWEVLSFLVFLPLFWLGFSVLRRRWERKTGTRETLDQRYANGEITREEYLTIRGDIKRNQNA